MSGPKPSLDDAGTQALHDDVTAPWTEQRRDWWNDRLLAEYIEVIGTRSGAPVRGGRT